MRRLSFHLPHPFWPVTLVSGALAICTFLILLSIYSLTGRWQYLALCGLVLLIILAHGVAWWLARARGHFVAGIWLIAAAQILSALLTPLVMADYWIIGLFLLLVIPVEVGVADQLRRMPLAAVLSLLGAAAMVAIDLLSLPDRLTILGDLPGAIILALTVVILHLTSLTYLLWRLRLRPSATYHAHLDVATQQSLVFTAISALSILLVTGVLIGQIRTSQIQQVGRNFQTLAEINAERVGNSLEQQINALLSFGRREVVLLEGLAAANDQYPASASGARRLLLERDQTWQTSSENSDFVLQYRNNPQTLELSKFRGNDLLHNNVFLTDRHGGLVAAQGEKPAKYFYGDEPWWQAAWDGGRGGIYLGDLTIDSESHLATIFIAVSVLNPQTNHTVGVLASTYDLRKIQEDIGQTRPRTTGELAVLSASGVLIAGPNEAAIGRPAWPALISAGIRPDESSPPSLLEPGWLLGQDSEGEAAVLAFAPLNTTSLINREPLGSLGWQVVVSDTQANALAEVTRSMKVASLVGLLAMAMVVVASTAIARVITRPIEALTTTATAITEGKLDQRANPAGPIELVTLAEAFNTLTGRLRSLITSLQDQVDQRTAQLEARAEQLATLNRITQAVSSVRDLQAALEIVAREMGQLFQARNCGIALLNAERTELTVVADHALNPNDPSAVGIVLPLAGNLSSTQVVETGRPLVVTNVQTNPLTTSIHGLMRERQTQAVMIVPLLARGQVIGTIGLATEQANRIFTPAEVELAETIAGQVTGAIENARLFTEIKEAMEAAEAANEAKSAFLANVSHELRTPLTSVLGFAKIIQKRLEDKIFPAVQPDNEWQTQRAIGQVRENVAIIIAEGKRLTTLINDVLDLAKIEAGKVEWHMELLPVERIVERAIAATSALLEQKKLKLIKDVAEDLPEIMGDQDRLIQVIINLLSNAVKFTSEGTVTCRARLAGDQILISVMDTGIGIELADQARVFDKFIQAGDNLIEKPQGTGLGLAICKQIVEHHGGRIWVESESGRGSIFSLSLPVASLAVREDEQILTVGQLK